MNGFSRPQFWAFVLLSIVVGFGANTAQAQLTGDAATKFDMATFVAGGVLSQPTDIAFLPDGRVMIAQKNGAIAVCRAMGTACAMMNATAGRAPATVDTQSEKGLLGLAIDPGFAQNKAFYIYVSNGDTMNKHRVYRGTIADNNAITFDANPIIANGLEGPDNHDGGTVMIYKNQLYVSVGDTGANNPIPRNKYGSCLNRANGKILRVNLDGTIPSDNPLTGVPMVTACDSTTKAAGNFTMAPPDTRVYAWGFRNPFRFWIDQGTGRMWIGDVGERASEEITVSDPVAVAGYTGQHHGYPFVEGSVTYTMAQQPYNTFGGCSGMVPGKACTAPVHAYPHAGGDDCVIGGPIPYDGCGWPDDYKTKYFYGDHGSNRLFTLNVNADRSGVVNSTRTTFGTIGKMSSLVMGHNAGLYATIEASGAVVIIQPKNLPANCLMNAAPPPADGGAALDGSAPPMAGRGGAGAGGTGGMATAGRGGSGGAGGIGGVGAGGAPAGGMGGAVAGTGGTPGTAGRGGTSGAGGSTMATAGSTGSGSAGSGGAGATPDTTASDAGGCGCSTTGDPGLASVLATLAFAGMLFARRRRRR